MDIRMATPVNNFAAAEARELVVVPSRLGGAPVACVAPVLEKQAPGLGCPVSSQGILQDRSQISMLWMHLSGPLSEVLHFGSCSECIWDLDVHLDHAR